MESTDWRLRAACRGEDSQLFFPVTSDGYALRSSVASAPALRVCRYCDVQHECLLYTLSLPEDPPGVWGGTTSCQRRPLRRSLAVHPGARLR